MEQSPLARRLAHTTETTESLENLPLKYARILREETRGLDEQTRTRAINMIRDWVTYANTHKLNSEDLFSLNYHLKQFIRERDNQPESAIHLEHRPLSTISGLSHVLDKEIGTYTDPSITQASNVALVGGPARIALKTLAGISTDSERPISDIDAVISIENDPDEIANTWDLDIADTKLVSGDIAEALPKLLAEFDCTLNQVAIHNGELYFTEQALEDITNGAIRILPNNKAPFAPEAIRTPEGHPYLTPNGFYRGLSLLLRDKGQHLIVSKENLEAEHQHIGRYWLVVLFVKILPMQHERARAQAIGHWHDLAKQIGSTQTASPEAFLHELMAAHPEMKRYKDARKGTFDQDKQIRWLIKKAVQHNVESLTPNSPRVLPSTYTETQLTKNPNTTPVDLEHFMSEVEAL